MDRIITGEYLDGDEIQTNLRPSLLEEYFGQEKVKETLKIYIEASKNRKEALDHVLLYGPPGLGKTTLATIIARELSVNIRITSGPAIEKTGDLAAILTNLSQHDVLFIDEIHRLSRSVEEVLYSAMEDFVLDIVMGKGPAARSIRIDIPKFTLIGATTRAGLLTSPLRDRFGIMSRLVLYSIEELSMIIRRSSKILNVKTDEDGVYQIASRSRGTPRIANRLLKRLRDYAQVKADGCITKSVAEAAFGMLEIDERGLDIIDRQILNAIITMFGGGPVGVETLAVSIGEEPETVEDVYEPYLINLGFLSRTTRGRVATSLAYEYLNKPMTGQVGFEI